ncbi:lytic transglycosylase domain-containing protein [Desulfitobacterium metallireducens]|uniref:lytic transglycosylase domain-containing protein n=1 Tax=Desulfitobacterium metallireducens TaxID=142877 RepID=UPI00249DD3B0|nr:transglycosylase SLT domain-containing protein [Desulfitobacterium metallireducens]
MNKIKPNAYKIYSQILYRIKIDKIKIYKLFVLFGAMAVIYYFLFFNPPTKLTSESLIDFLSRRNPPTWLVPSQPNTVIDIEQTKKIKRVKLAELKKKVYVVQLDFKNAPGKDESLNEESDLDEENTSNKSYGYRIRNDLSDAASTLLEFWSITIVTVPSQDPAQDQPQKMIVGEGSQPINLDDRVLRWQKEIETAAEKYDIEPALIAAVIEQESGGEPEALSPVGAIGLMQLMPSTAELMGVNPYDPAQNIDGGAHYLQQQLESFGSVQTALAAYNAGPGEAENGHWIKIPETLDYVQNVPVLIRKYERLWQENREKT